MISLKPCPHCGGPVDFNCSIDFGPDGVRCKKCGVIVRSSLVRPMQKGETFGDVMDRIAEWWNRRKG